MSTKEKAKDLPLYARGSQGAPLYGTGKAVNIELGHG